MTERGTHALGAALAIGWLVVLAAADIAIPGGHFVLASLFALAALIACALLPPVATGLVALLCVGLSVAAGAWDGDWGQGQQTIRILDVAIVSGAAVVVAVVRVRREQRHARVSAIAEVAQRAVLPTLPRRTAHLTVAARYVSAAQDAVVGGDLYDCFHSATYTRFLLGDVRGKGIAGVEQAARVIRAFRQSAATEPTLPEVARQMSSYLSGFFDDEEFVTAVLAEESSASRLTLVSCGHPPPLRVSSGSGSFVELPAGLPLGLGDDYEAGSASLGPGDRLLMYTDGLSEARDSDGEFLRLLDLTPVVAVGAPDDVLDGVLDVVRRHVAGGELTDDLAMLLLERTAVEHPVTASTGGRACLPDALPDESSVSSS